MRPASHRTAHHPEGECVIHTSVVLDETALDALAAALADRVHDLLAPASAFNAGDPHMPYLNTDQAAHYLASSRQRIYDLVSSGRLTALKEGTRSLYRREDLDALIQETWPQRGPGSENSCKLAA